jgi:hypothetical protein
MHRPGLRGTCPGPRSEGRYVLLPPPAGARYCHYLTFGSWQIHIFQDSAVGRRSSHPAEPAGRYTDYETALRYCRKGGYRNGGLQDLCDLVGFRDHLLCDAVFLPTPRQTFRGKSPIESEVAVSKLGEAEAMSSIASL